MRRLLGPVYGICDEAVGEWYTAREVVYCKGSGILQGNKDWYVLPVCYKKNPIREYER